MLLCYILCYRDTDSFIIYINQSYDSVNYSGVEKFFDLSGYNVSSNKYNKTNKGVLGTLKDEYPLTRITNFVCLKSKCYIVQTESGKTVVKNKGVTDSGKLKLVEFEAVLSNRLKEINVTQCSIKSFKHRVFTVEFSKKSLSADGDLKRVGVLNDKFSGFDMYETKAFGHYLLNN